MRTPEPKYVIHFACVKCRSSFNRSPILPDPSLKHQLVENCPNCGSYAIFVGHLFEPPTSKSEDQWQAIKYLIENGFLFQQIFDEDGEFVDYPKTLASAEVFVLRYGRYAQTDAIPIVRKALSAA